MSRAFKALDAMNNNNQINNNNQGNLYTYSQAYNYRTNNNYPNHLNYPSRSNATGNTHPAEPLGNHHYPHVATSVKTRNPSPTHGSSPENLNYDTFPLLPIKNPYAADPPPRPEPSRQHNQANDDYSALP
ncbi:hypothetical protein BG015_011757 [Linnemannia schmuckeri]|uniref:Uncharacterized protein n=1 Tax=Linnemannia schmuckeri TaxID=64567 RepID=A0A9P5RSB7_9FUNG|nr:hypothetical protein BG015_011757 [Linnemannia schmuckeri]